ncbi:hypothetical protein BD779DRAFT_1475101 [Infundibulicybe gibba]|nr:hypothetical protein BD779DRAFT_1475101 [Infundibulicybe gibba]
MKTEQEQYQSFVRMFNQIVTLPAKFHSNNLRIASTRNLNDPTMVLGPAVSWKLDAAGGDQVEAMIEKSDAPHYAESESVSQSEPSGTTPGSSMSGLPQTGLHADGSVPTASGRLLFHRGLRKHVIAALVTRNSVELVYYDRSITIKYSPFNFINDRERLVAWIIGMTRLDAVGWRFDPIRPRMCP